VYETNALLKYMSVTGQSDSCASTVLLIPLPTSVSLARLFRNGLKWSKLGFGPRKEGCFYKENVETEEIQKLFSDLRKRIKAILGQFGKMHARC
jgi:hypothetical protein